jgi:hypothetical protein
VAPGKPQTFEDAWAALKSKGKARPDPCRLPERRPLDLSSLIPANAIGRSPLHADILFLKYICADFTACQSPIRGG